MEFGIFLILQSPAARPSEEIYRRAIELTQAAEILGFARVWLAEHHFSNYSYSSQPLTFLSFLAAKTKKIRLGTAIVPLPLHHPLLLAENFATVDILSHGRVDAGIGKGYQYYQYERLDIKKDEDNKFSESLDILLKALEGKPFQYSGKYFNIPETVIYPQPLQQPIPTWLVINTKNKSSLLAALQRNLNIFTGVLEPISQLTHIESVYPELFQANKINRYIGTQRPVFVSYHPAEVRQVAEEIRWNARVSLRMRHHLACVTNGKVKATPFAQEPSIDEIIQEYMVAGNPDECIQQLTRLQKGLGINYFSGSFWFGSMNQQQVLQSMELFAKEVLPAFSTKQSTKLEMTY